MDYIITTDALTKQYKKTTVVNQLDLLVPGRMRIWIFRAKWRREIYDIEDTSWTDPPDFGKNDGHGRSDERAESSANFGKNRISD